MEWRWQKGALGVTKLVSVSYRKGNEGLQQDDVTGNRMKGIPSTMLDT